MARTARATWNGGLKDGNGTMGLGSGSYEGPFTYRSRFEEGEGTNPEELIGAAHAACFSMALSNILAGDGHTPDSVRTQARVHLRNVDGAPTIARIELETEGRVEGLDEDGFRGYAEQAKKDCPVSRALGAVGEIEVSARLA